MSHNLDIRDVTLELRAQVTRESRFHNSYVILIYPTHPALTAGFPVSQAHPHSLQFRKEAREHILALKAHMEHMLLVGPENAFPHTDTHGNRLPLHPLATLWKGMVGYRIVRGLYHPWTGGTTIFTRVLPQYQAAFDRHNIEPETSAPDLVTGHVLHFREIGDE